MYLNEDTINKIIDYSLKIIKPYLVYIFGSAVNGNFNEDSDIDIAFLSDEEFTDYEVFIMAQELADIVKKGCGFNKSIRTYRNISTLYRYTYIILSR